MWVPSDLSAEALAKAEAFAKEGCFGGFRTPSIHPSLSIGCDVSCSYIGIVVAP